MLRLLTFPCALLGLAGCFGGATPRAPDLVLVVLDTVRADHLSACGYARPTSPFLERMRAHPSARFTCDAHTPGTWTLPSHASYFTGLSVPEHGADSQGTGVPDEVPTLAETLAAKGYATVLVSANPVLGMARGLDRGFQIKDIASSLTSMRGPKVARSLKAALDSVPEDQPLFVVVNILDAHDPYPAIPADAGWVPARPPLELEVRDDVGEGTYTRYIRGELPPDRASAYISRVTDGYDWGVRQADETLEAVVGVLRKRGVFETPYRMVVTSDHGEFLGEHGLLRHGCFVWEPVTRVPFLVVDTTGAAPVDLASPFSTLGTHPLMLHGALPAGGDVFATSRGRRQDPRGCADMVALWPEPSRKLVWREGQLQGFDLGADPAELAGAALGDDDEGVGRLKARAAAHAAHLEASRAAAEDAAQAEALEALGYIQ